MAQATNRAGPAFQDEDAAVGPSEGPHKMKKDRSCSKGRKGRRPAAASAALGLLFLSLTVPAAARADGLQTWNTFLGGGGWDTGRALAVDFEKNIFVCGTSDGSWGSPVRPYTGKNDVFVAKLDRTGRLLWSTFLGGAGTDNAFGVAVDGFGDIFVAGASNVSWGAPVTPLASGYDAFLAKLGPDGTLVWNTFAGGGGADQANAVAVDSEGSAYIVGSSTEGWGTPEGEYWAGSDGFMARFDVTGALVWNTFLGGNGEDYARGITIGTSGDIYAVGSSTDTWGVPTRGWTYYSDGWAAKLDTFGHIYWNSFVGGEGYDDADGIAVDYNGFSYVTGSSNVSWSDPIVDITSGYDAFVAKLDVDGTVLWNTFLGGDAKDFGRAIDCTDDGYVAFAGYSLDTWGETPLSEPAGGYDISIAKLDTDGNVIWNAFVGGAGDEFLEGAAIGRDRNIYFIGVSDAGWGTPVREFSANYDAFVAMIPETPVVEETVSASVPAQGTFFLAGKSPRFAWEANGPAAFKIELSNGADFSARVLSLPASGGWLDGQDYVPDAAEMDLIRALAPTGRVVYWRVRGLTGRGREVVSASRWFAVRAFR
jgi:hypothetical protein